MGDCTVDSKDGAPIRSAIEMLLRFSGEVALLVPGWEERLKQNPEELETLEREIVQAYKRGAGLMIAGLVSVVMQTQEFAETSEQIRQEYGIPLAKGRTQKLGIRLLGGVMMWATSLYCEPMRGSFRDPDDGASGLHIELAQFGFGRKESPGQESKMARLSALCPSFELARDEMNRDGESTSTGVVRRVAQQCGDDLLKLRTIQILEWRAGTLKSTGEMAGKRVTVQIDGGRTRIRGKLREIVKNTGKTEKPATPAKADPVTSEAPARSKTRPKTTFDGEWREPKLLTIFVHDEHGQMVKEINATIDGTFTGPDATAELVAMHLHRLGAARAESITFVSDGATWIWDRIDSIVQQAAIPESVRIYRVLDNCHAAHHISLALGSLTLDSQTRAATYRELRSRLRNGQWRFVVKELQQQIVAGVNNETLLTEIAYLVKHGEAGHLRYTLFKALGLPLGSGAIESSIRRVINLRLKNSSTFWREENAESMLQLRSLVISGRWDERLKLMRLGRKSINLTDWSWEPHLMSNKVESNSKSAKNTA